MIFVFVFAAVMNNTAIAQGQSLPPQMYQNLNDMSGMLGDISAQLSTGKMTAEAQKTAAKIKQRMSHILQDLAGLGNGIHYTHQAEIKKMKKSWDPFAEESATHD